MAVARQGRVIGVELPTAQSRILQVELDAPLGFAGGQYVIVDTGLKLPSGKARKRAYSIMSPDSDQLRITLAAQRLPDGPASAYINGLEAGDTLTFSGPWGKMQPVAQGAGPGLVLATDTGITAALGLVQGHGFERLVGATIFVWLRHGEPYLLPEAQARELLPPRLRVVRMDALPKVHHPERVGHVLGVVNELRRRIGLSWAYLCGDGDVNRAVSQELLASGMPATHCLSETFFNGPKKSS